MTPVNDSMSRMADEEWLIPVTGEGDEDEAAPVSAQEGDGVEPSTPIEEAHDEVKPVGEDFATKYEALRLKYEGDIGKLKSSLQKREGELLKEKSVLEKKLEELLESTMDDEGRKKYQQDKLAEDLAAIKAERDELKLQNEASAQRMVWTDFFTDVGVPKAELKSDGELQELFQSGMDALIKRIKTLEEKGKQPVTETTKGKTPPSVAQSTKGKLPVATTLDEAIKHFAKGDEEKFWRMAELGNAAVLQVLNELGNTK